VVTRLVAVRPEERRGTVAAFLTIFGTLGAHTLLETARDALFLARLPAARHREFRPQPAPRHRVGRYVRLLGTRPLAESA
jgi:hypothetical protein